MILTSTLLLAVLQVGPNPNAVPLTDGHSELRDRQEREDSTAPENPGAIWLADCLEQLSQDASRAHTMAQIKRNETAGSDRILANHCLGLAATELGRWDDAVTAFSEARDETPDDEARARARFGLMAGNAALASGDAARAEAILSRTKLDAGTAASAPLQAIAASDLARALVVLNRPEEALAELEMVTTLEPGNAGGWLLKATLLRRLERLDAAQVAIEQAGSLAPINPAIGLEAGVIAVLSGREEAARASWQSVVAIDRAGPAGQTAQEYLAQLGPAPAQSEANSGGGEEPS